MVESSISKNFARSVRRYFASHRVFFQTFLSILLGCSLLAFSVQGAAAQAVDWVVNINDATLDPSPAGGLVDYSIRITNDGFNAAPATSLSLTVPSGTVLEATTGAITGCAPLPATGPATVSCPVPALAAGTDVGFTARLRSSAQGMIAFGASVPAAAGTATDTQPGNNAVTENTSITAGADVALTMTGPNSATSGSVVTYALAATNNGPDAVGNLTLTFPVPTGLANITPRPAAR
ncbi:hypothetical protein [Paracoccus sp. S3-43]|uniref:hypothetical protein n=1 Tax=Paracoccus sp. S3-43 TaxID=3030011 RepID=UPI0023AE8F1E|nr:hypothetical protein [Paracoccus sp. S3-43]WEF25170.1 hypothetical protein PXD02_04300 [Paracoccus sp. S3-43]